MIFFCWVCNLSLLPWGDLKQDAHGTKTWTTSKEALLLSEPLGAALCFSGCVFSAYICWIELIPSFLADSRVLWKNQAITVHCKQNMFLSEFQNGRGTICPHFKQSDFWIIKAKIIEISMYLLVVFGLFAFLFAFLKCYTALFLSSFGLLIKKTAVMICQFSVPLCQDNRVLYPLHYVSFIGNLL